MTKPKYRRLTYDDRRVIENMYKAKKTQSEIANAIGVSQSTISRELSRNPVEGVYTHGRAFMRTYLRLLLKPKRYLIGEKSIKGNLAQISIFKRRRRKYGIKDYRGQIRNRVSIESRPEIVAERSRFGDWE